MVIRLRLLRDAMSCAVRAAAAALVAAGTAAQADSGHPAAPRSAVVQPAGAFGGEVRVAVMLRASPGKAAQSSPGREGASTAAASPLTAPGATRAAHFASRLALPMLADGRVLGDRLQSLRLPASAGIDAHALAARLAALPEVEWAEPVGRRRARGQVPNDPLFGDGVVGATPRVGQWFLRAPTATFVSATDAVGAWAVTTGSPTVRVAVLDTGVRFDHPDLASKLERGYDFIADTKTANDGDGRDADASDPGDWATSADSCYSAMGGNDSSWHGTQVAGLVAAAGDNGLGGVGLARDVRVLPVRVLGRCGGWDDDIVAGMLWAGGLSSTPVANPTPARVLNLSLGEEGSCTSLYTNAVKRLGDAGVVVVAAAGNATGHAVHVPANCSGVVGVAGLRHAGSKVGYSNIGPEVAIAAPAGNCVNTALGSECLYPLATSTNAGTTAPGANIWSDSYDNVSLGTSFATPLVAGAAALMLSANPSLSPSQVRTLLQASARPFPRAGGTDAAVVACRAPDDKDQLECYCTTSTCGAGMLDARRAVQQAAQTAQPMIVAPAASTVVVGASVMLASAPVAPSGLPIAAWRWQVQPGSGRADFVGAADGASVTLKGTAVGSVTVTLTVTDTAAQAHTAALELAVVAAPEASGGASSGGGGAFGVPSVLGLLAAAWALGPRRRRGGRG